MGKYCRDSLSRESLSPNFYPPTNGVLTYILLVFVLLVFIAIFKKFSYLTGTFPIYIYHLRDTPFGYWLYPEMIGVSHSPLILIFKKVVIWLYPIVLHPSFIFTLTLILATSVFITIEDCNSKRAGYIKIAITVVSSFVLLAIVDLNTIGGLFSVINMVT